MEFELGMGLSIFFRDSPDEYILGYSKSYFIKVHLRREPTNSLWLREKYQWITLPGVIEHTKCKKSTLVLMLHKCTKLKVSSDGMRDLRGADT